MLFLAGLYVHYRNPWAGMTVSHRLRWWSYAFQMAIDRPFLGNGPGSFEKKLAFFSEPGVNSVFAHTFPLQTAAELGVPAAILLLVFLYAAVRAVQSPFLKAGLIAALLQSFFDFTLTIHGNLLAFMMVLGAASEPRPSGEAGAQGAWPVLAGAAAAAALILGGWRWALRPYLAFESSLNAQGAFAKMDLVSAESFLRKSIALDGLAARYPHELAGILALRHEKEPQNGALLDEALRFQTQALAGEPGSRAYRERMAALLDRATAGAKKR